MPNATERAEYVLADKGMVWQGSWPRPWIYGQFVEVVLDTVLNLIEEKAELTEEQWADVRFVTRALTWLGNSFEGGLVAGRWDGHYSDGTEPATWSSAAQIIKLYNQTRSSVRYGQCWVFGATLTTMVRALGVPARPITNLGSAHDTDDSLTIDNFFDRVGLRLHPNLG